MKTILDLLSPPCPPEALGEEMLGFDFASPAIPELEAFFERFKTGEEPAPSPTSDFSIPAIPELEVSLDSSKTGDGPVPDSDWEEWYDRCCSMKLAWVHLRHKALGTVRRIDTKQVPSATLLEWIQASREWTRLARSDFNRVIGRYNAPPLSSFITAKDRNGREVEVPISEEFREAVSSGLFGSFEQISLPCSVREDHGGLLRASDGVLSVWAPFDETEMNSRELDLAPPGSRLEGRIMQEGELCDSNNNFCRHWNNSLLQIVGNHWMRKPTLELTKAQLGYIRTFIGPQDSDWPSRWEPVEVSSEDQVVHLKPMDDSKEAGPILYLIPRPSRVGWPSRGTYVNHDLHEAALAAGWSLQEVQNHLLFFFALQEESMSQRYKFYPGRMHFADRW